MTFTGVGLVLFLFELQMLKHHVTRQNLRLLLSVNLTFDIYNNCTTKFNYTGVSFRCVPLLRQCVFTVADNFLRISVRSSHISYQPPKASIKVMHNWLQLHALHWDSRK